MKTHHLLVVASVFALTGVSAVRAQSADPSGHWEGTVEIPGRSLRFAFDLGKDAAGQLIGTISGEEVRGLPLTKVAVAGRSVTLQASAEQPFTGDMSADGRTISGAVVLSGYSLPLELTRTGEATIEPPPTSAPIGKELEGTWEGTLNAGRGPLRVVLKMANQPGGKSIGHFISVDEGGLLIPIVITQNASSVSYVATAIPSQWTGVLSADGRELAGTFTQGSNSLPLNFRRSAATAGK